MSDKKQQEEQSKKDAIKVVSDRFRTELQKGKVTIVDVKKRLEDEGLDQSHIDEVVQEIIKPNSNIFEPIAKPSPSVKAKSSLDTKDNSSLKNLFTKKQKRPNICYSDTETTGADHRFRSAFQILTACHIYRNEEEDKELERLNVTMKLKKDKPVTPMALMVNNLNPYTKTYNDNAVTEKEYLELLQKTNLKHKVLSPDGKDILPKMSAYNIAFDREMISCAMSRSGFKFRDTFNPSSQDPLPSIRRLSKAKGGEIVLENKKLTTVADYFGVELGDKAHTAEGDTLALIGVSKKAFELVSKGRDLKDFEPVTHSELEVGETYYIGSNSTSSGYKERALYILGNDVDNRKIIAIDSSSLEAYEKTREGSKNNLKEESRIVREFNYDTIEGIIDGDSIEIQSKKNLALNAYKEKPEYFEAAKANKEAEIQERLLKSRGDEFALATYDHEGIAQIADMLHSKEVSLKEVREILRTNPELEEKDINTVITKATEYNQAVGRGHFGDRDYHNDKLHELINKDMAELNYVVAHKKVPEELTDGEMGAITLFANLRERFPEEYSAEKYPFAANCFQYIDEDNLVVSIGDAKSIKVTLPEELPEREVKVKKPRKNAKKKEEVIEEKTPLELAIESEEKEEKKDDKVAEEAEVPVEKETNKEAEKTEVKVEVDSLDLLDQLPSVEVISETETTITVSEIKEPKKAPKVKAEPTVKKVPVKKEVSPKAEKTKTSSRCKICSKAIGDGDVGHICRKKISKAKSDLKNRDIITKKEEKTKSTVVRIAKTAKKAVKKVPSVKKVIKVVKVVRVETTKDNPFEDSNSLTAQNPDNVTSIVKNKKTSPAKVSSKERKKERKKVV